MSATTNIQRRFATKQTPTRHQIGREASTVAAQTPLATTTASSAKRISKTGGSVCWSSGVGCLSGNHSLGLPLKTHLLVGARRSFISKPTTAQNRPQGAVLCYQSRRFGRLPDFLRRGNSLY